jgi:hypothetical protein
MYVTKDLDFFDVGQSLGDLILERCQLEDAFFIASLLEAPLDQLRARGFPVDRILKPKPPPEEPKKPETAQTSAPKLPASNAKDDAQGSNGDTPKILGPARNASEAPITSNGSANYSATSESQSQAQGSSASNDDVLSADEIMTMVQQMFPDADEMFLREAMGSNPSLEGVRRLAEKISTGDYPRRKEQPQPDAASQSPPDSGNEQLHLVPDPPKEKPEKRGSKAGGLKKSIGRALGNFRGGGGGASSSSTIQQHHQHQHDPSPRTEYGSTTDLVSPEYDAAAYANMNRMLENAAANSAAVNSEGIHSTETLLTSVPKELDRGATCEVIPGQALKPFSGPRGDGMTHNGIRVFSARNSPESEPFLQNNDDAIEKFALLIKRLATVYDVDQNATAIFHDPRGGTIAFNSNSSLHFNARFFHALHYLQNKHQSYECYSYWYVVFAHELSHNLATGHNKEHGFYTESYVAKYLPKFLALMGTLPKTY